MSAPTKCLLIVILFTCYITLIAKSECLKDESKASFMNFESLDRWLTKHVPNDDPDENLNKAYEKSLRFNLWPSKMNKAVLVWKDLNNGRCDDEAFQALVTIVKNTFVLDKNPASRIERVIRPHALDMVSRCKSSIERRFLEQLNKLEPVRRLLVEDLINNKFIEDYYFKNWIYGPLNFFGRNECANPSNFMQDTVESMQNLFLRDGKLVGAEKPQEIINNNKSYFYSKYVYVPCRHYVNGMSKIYKEAKALAMFEGQEDNGEHFIQHRSEDFQRFVFRYRFCKVIKLR